MELDIPINWKIIISMMLVIIVLKTIMSFDRNKKSTKRITKTPKKTNKIKHNNSIVRTDEEILASKLGLLTGFEFERVMAIYFREKGYQVREVGSRGKDGGVDLVLTDREGAKTAVQLKRYTNKKIPVQTVRELIGAKRNYDCLYALLITTSDFTEPALKEAHDLKVECWHGGVVDNKISAWRKKRINNSRLKR
jgi:restriction system protein